MNSRRWWRTGKPGVLPSMGHKEADTTEQLDNSKEQRKLDLSILLPFK